MRERHSPRTVRRCCGDQSLRDGHVLQKQSEDALRTGCHAGMREHRHVKQGPRTQTIRHSWRSVTPWDMRDVRMAKTIRREWASREMMKLEWRA